MEPTTQRKSLDEIFGSPNKQKSLDDIFGKPKLSLQEQNQEGMADIRQIGTDIQTSLADRNAKIESNKARQEAGEQSGLRTGLQNVGQVLGFGADAIGATIKGGAKALLPQGAEETVKESIQTVAEPIVQSAPVQSLMEGWEKLKVENPKLAADIDAGLGLGEFISNFVGVGIAGKGGKVALEGLEQGGKQVLKQGGEVLDTIGTATRSAIKVPQQAIQGARGTVQAIKDTGGDVLKEFSPQQLSERNFAKAFKLAPNDVVELDSIAQAPVSEWALSNNLIKGTGEDTVEEMIKFKMKNYNAVRDAVDSVDETFSFKDIPEAENIVDDLIAKTEGLQSQKYKDLNSQLKSVADKLNKGQSSLGDVQFVKSAFDDIESIFKRSSQGGSEFKEGLKFKDLGESRSQVQRFIEDRVLEKMPNVNIKELNRNVRVAKGLVDDIAKRAGKFDTQSSASLGDYFVFGLGQQALPGGGPAAFAIKKVVESAPIRLRLTKLLSRGKKKPSPTDLKAIEKEIIDALEAQLDIKQQ